MALDMWYFSNFIFPQYILIQSLIVTDYEVLSYP